MYMYVYPFMYVLSIIILKKYMILYTYIYTFILQYLNMYTCIHPYRCYYRIYSCDPRGVFIYIYIDVHNTLISIYFVYSPEVYVRIYI
jgi:hypothetical protein